MGESEFQTLVRSIFGFVQSFRKVFDLFGDSFSFQNKENVIGGVVGDLILIKKKVVGEGVLRGSLCL